MDSDKVLAELQAIEQTAFNIKQVEAVNFNPHPYTIGPRHLQYNDSMYLGKEQILQMEAKRGPMCAHPKCRLPYKEHTCDWVAFISAAKNLTKEEAHKALLALKPVAESTGLSGFAFIRSEYSIEGVK